MDVNNGIGQSVGRSVETTPVSYTGRDVACGVSSSCHQPRSSNRTLIFGCNPRPYHSSLRVPLRPSPDAMHTSAGRRK
jgi:hypothetical protein